ncbi:MAG: HD domain-containing protein [Oscillospiraceae bacterium]|nr:HD domain-containing protein [Oscillospiraceae bacterium]
MKIPVYRVIDEMIRYNGGAPNLIQHALKVYAFAKAIGEEEGLSEETQEILETAAVLHDIGIRESERKYGDADGVHQQVEGPPIAEEILQRLGAAPALIERVCYLIAHHHTYSGVEGMDYRILIEADFLVNVYETPSMQASASEILKKNFETASGARYFKAQFLSGSGC